MKIKNVALIGVPDNCRILLTSLVYCRQLIVASRRLSRSSVQLASFHYLLIDHIDVHWIRAI